MIFCGVALISCSESESDATPGAGDTTSGAGDTAAGAGDTTSGAGDTAAGAGDTGGGTVSAAYYSGPESAALGKAGNQARCSTCHSTDGSHATSGVTFKDIAYKTSFKGGDAPGLLEATNACVTGWMGGVALTDSSTEYASLRAYLESVSDAESTTPNPLTPEVLADQAAYETAYAGGDATAGAAAFETHCGVCHSAGLVVAGTAAYPVSTLKAFPAGRIAQKVRTSGPPPSGSSDASDSTPGPMPFFEEEDVSTAALKDIVAFLVAK